jgi:hypothetical protein
VADREKLIELAERGAELAGPDRTVDAEIYVAVHGLVKTGALRSDGSVRTAVPRYTASLDAAITLVPEGCQWSFDSHYGIARVFTYFSGDQGPDCLEHEAEAVTPALALTATALRARAAEQEGR